MDKINDIISEKLQISIDEMRISLDVTNGTIARYISELKDYKVIERIGSIMRTGGKYYCGNYVQMDQTIVIRLEMDYIWIMLLCSKVVPINGN